MRSVELFAGCGGLALGLSKAGFVPVCLVEKDAACISTIKLNRERGIAHVSAWPELDEDVTAISFKGWRDQIDLVSGGPPCQPFSIGGKHLGPADQRNMWPEAIRAVREIRPKAFVFENVRGLLRPDFAYYLHYIRLQLTWPEMEMERREGWRSHLKRLIQHANECRDEQREYHVVVQPLNTADYGAPQKRHRVVIVGVRRELSASLDLPTGTHSQEALAWSKHVSRSYWRRHCFERGKRPSSSSEKFALDRLLNSNAAPPHRPWVTVRDALVDLPKTFDDPQLLANSRIVHGARSYANHTGSDLDEPAKALKAGDHGVPGGENMIAYPRGNVRYFTVREMARLQGFPDDFAVAGSWKAATRQLGNAVPVQVGFFFGEYLRRLLQQKNKLAAAA